MNAIKKTDYHKTKIACYMGFITQAIAANFAPLLFLKFHSDYHISLGNIALISTFFFFTQLALAVLVSFISSDALRKLTVIFCFVKTDNDATFKNSRRHLICSFVFLGRSGNPKFSLKYVY